MLNTWSKCLSDNKLQESVKNVKKKCRQKTKPWYPPTFLQMKFCGQKSACDEQIPAIAFLRTLSERKVTEFCSDLSGISRVNLCSVKFTQS